MGHSDTVDSIKTYPMRCLPDLVGGEGPYTQEAYQRSSREKCILTVDFVAVRCCLPLRLRALIVAAFLLVSYTANLCKLILDCVREKPAQGNRSIIEIE